MSFFLLAIPLGFVIALISLWPKRERPLATVHCIKRKKGPFEVVTDGYTVAVKDPQAVLDANREAIRELQRSVRDQNNG